MFRSNDSGYSDPEMYESVEENVNSLFNNKKGQGKISQMSVWSILMTIYSKAKIYKLKEEKKGK